MQVAFASLVAFMAGSILTWFWCGRITSDASLPTYTDMSTMRDPSDCAAFVKSNLPHGEQDDIFTHHCSSC